MYDDVRKARRALRDGGVIELDGLMLRMVEGKENGESFVPGDLYVAGRNTGPHLLTVRSVNHDGGWVVPTCPAYAFDLSECVGVEEA